MATDISTSMLLDSHQGADQLKPPHLHPYSLKYMRQSVHDTQYTEPGSACQATILLYTSRTSRPHQFPALLF